MNKRQMKKEEEQKILAQMEEAMKESETPQAEKKLKWYQDKTPEKIHCRQCKTLIEDGVCPVCGFRMYTPMDKKKQQRIRLILGAVCIVAFLIWFVATQLG